MGRLVSIYLARPLVAVTACVLAGMLVEGPADEFAQIALATPTVVALLLCVVDWERMAFGAAGFAGAIALGLTVAGREASDTITGYDLTFLVNWAIVSVFSGVPVYGIFYIWAAFGEARRGINELVERESDAGRATADEARPVPATEMIEAATAGGSAPIVPGRGPGGQSPAGIPSVAERPANFAAEELVASLEAYRVNGEPWWRCSEPQVLVQYRDRAQMEIESRVVPFLGWTRESPPLARQGASVQRKPGMFTFNFRIGTAPAGDDLTVMWVRRTSA